jgi:hypothetical protein
MDFPSVGPTGRPHVGISVRVALNQIVRLGCRREGRVKTGTGKEGAHSGRADVGFPNVVPTGRFHDGISVRVARNQIVRLGCRRERRMKTELLVLF